MDHGRRVARVSERLAAFLDEAVDIERAAEIARLSPHHFHRVFRSMTGETVAEASRRFRMQRAAAELLSGGGTIPAIGRRAGYASVEAFTRAFTAAHGTSPAAYRDEGKRGSLFEAVPAVEIRELAPVQVVALRYVGPYDEIGPTCQQLHVRAVSRGVDLSGFRALTIFHDDPEAPPPGGLRADICLAPPPPVPLDEGVRKLEIPGGPHAVLRHLGPYAELSRSYRYLLGVWLPSSGRSAADRPCFEEYVVDPRGRPPRDWVTDIHLPLV